MVTAVGSAQALLEPFAPQTSPVISPFAVFRVSWRWERPREVHPSARTGLAAASSFRVGHLLTYLLREFVLTADLRCRQQRLPARSETAVWPIRITAAGLWLRRNGGLPLYTPLSAVS